MGTLSGHGPINVTIVFPVGQTPAPVTCTWVYTGYQGRNVVAHMRDLYKWDLEEFQDSITFYPGVNKTTNPVYTLLPLYSRTLRGFVPAHAPAMTIVARFEPGRRGTECGSKPCNVTLRLTAPPASEQPLPCVNNSLTYVNHSRVVSNWQSLVGGNLPPQYSYPPHLTCRWLVEGVDKRVSLYYNERQYDKNAELRVTDITSQGNYSYLVTNPREYYNYGPGATFSAGSSSRSPAYPLSADSWENYYFPSSSSSSSSSSSTPPSSSSSSSPPLSSSATNYDWSTSQTYTSPPHLAYHFASAAGRVLIEFSTGALADPDEIVPGFAIFIDFEDDMPELCDGDSGVIDITSATTVVSNEGIDVYPVDNVRFLPHTRCTFPLRADPDMLITIAGSYGLIMNSDFLYVYDGPNASSPLLAKLSGFDRLDQLVTSSNEAFVVFQAGPAPITRANQRNINFGFGLLVAAADPNSSSSLTPSVDEVTLPPCPQRLVHSMTANIQNISFGIENDFSVPMPRNMKCSWLFKVPDDYSYTIELTASLGRYDFIYFYTGEAEDPQMLNRYARRDKQFGVSGGPLLIVFETDGTHYNDGWGFFMLVHPIRNWTPCMPYPALNRVPVPDTDSLYYSNNVQFGYPVSSWNRVPRSVYDDHEVVAKYMSNVDCLWLLDYGDLPLGIQMSNNWIAKGDRVIFYQGNSTDSPVIVDTGEESVGFFYHLQSPILVRFISDDSPLWANGQGFRLQVGITMPTLLPPDGSYDRVYSNIPGFSRWYWPPVADRNGYHDYMPVTYTGAHNVTYTWHYPPTFEMTQFHVCPVLKPGDQLYIYDGPNASCPLIVRYTAPEARPYFGSDSIFLGYGYDFSQLLLTSSALTMRILTYNSTVGRFSSTNGGEYGIEVESTWEETNLPNYAYGPGPGGSYCDTGDTQTYTISTAGQLTTLRACTGIHARYRIASALIYSDITFTNLVFMSSDSVLTFDAEQFQPGVVIAFPKLKTAGTLNFNARITDYQLPVLTWAAGLHFENMRLNVISIPTLASCNNLDLFLGGSSAKRINFDGLITLGSLRHDLFSNVTFSYPKLREITGTISFTYVMGVTQPISFPALQFANNINIGNFWTTSPCPVFEFPKLIAVFNQFSLYIVDYSTMSFPALEFAGDLTLRDIILPGPSAFPKLKYADSVNINFDGDSYHFDGTSMGPVFGLPSLRATSSITISGMNALTTVDFPNLAWGGFSVSACATLLNINVPLLKAATTFSVSGIAMKSVKLPNLIVGNLVLGSGMRDLFEVVMPKALFLGQMSLATGGLSSIDAGKLVIVDDLEILDGVMQTVSFPSLKHVGTFVIGTIPYIEHVYLPLLQTATTTLSIRDTIATELALPSLTQAVQLSFQNNRQLGSLKTCALEYAAEVRLQQMDGLSCTDSASMFDHVAESYEVILDGCNPTLFGVFGCFSNVTIAVDVSVCGHTVACIQEYMDRAYSDAHIVVNIPPGTYTGCGAPLDFGGRRFELRGSGVDQTFIDCQGSGVPFAPFDATTNADTIVSSLTVRNARAARNGAAVSIQGGSPLFRNVNFVSHSSSGNGGAVAVNGGTPTFTNCGFLGNQAMSSGGAVYVTAGALISITGCQFANNTALVNGGAVAFIGADAHTALRISNFSANQAVKGGAVYTEGSLELSGLRFDRNHASAFGGAVAAVPTSPIGNSLVATNVVATDNTADDRGGALFLYSCGLQMSQSELRGNNAARSGGAVYSQCSESYQTLFFVAGACPIPLMLSTVTLANNSAISGGGGGVYADHVIVDINDVVMMGNVVGGDGGAVAAVSSNFTGAGSSLTANRANRGGAVYCEARGTCALTGGDVSGNTALSAGGAFFFCVSQCEPEEGTSATSLQIAASTTTSSNMVSASGYGPLQATDPTVLTWAAAPAQQVVSGGAVAAASDKRLRVTIRDGFDQPVLSGDNVLQLSVGDSTGAKTGITLQGATTIFAPDGNAIFDVTTAIATATAQLNQAYLVTCKYATLPSVATTATFTLLPCGVGQGVSADAAASTGLVCADCAAGTYQNTDTSLPCVPCQPGSYNDAIGQTGCQPCAANSFQPASGAASCVACPAGSRSDGGTTECVSDSSAQIVVNAPTGALQGSASLYGLIAGIVVFLLIVFAIVARIVYRNARRKTMQQYYLDDDATVRQGSDAGLSALARKLISAGTTTRIGGGEFADIYKAKHDSRWIALKVLKNDSASQVLAQREFQREVTALSTLSAYKHPAVIELLFYIERNPMCIAMEFCPEGSLKRQLRELNLNLWDKVRMAAQVASGISLLHKVGIAHMDIKTDNILLVMGEETTDVKICDFGICRNFSRGRSGSGANSALGSQTTTALASNQVHNNPVFDSTGGSDLGTGKSIDLPLGPPSSLDSTESVDAQDAFTPQYIDPYRLLNQHDMSEATLKRADVFAFAMVMWAVYSRAEPFAGIDSKTLIRLRKETPGMRPPAIADCHECYGRLMERAWSADPAARPTIEECCKELTVCLHEHFSIDLPETYLKPLQRVDASPPPLQDSVKIHQMAKAAAGVEMQPVTTANLQTVAPPAPATPPPASADSFSSFGTANMSTMPPPPPGPPPPPRSGQQARATLDTSALETVAPAPPPRHTQDLSSLATIAPPAQPSFSSGTGTQVMHTQPIFPPP